MAYLEIESGSPPSYCGGFLIRPDAVLSAAHCVDKKGIESVTVILGAHNIMRQECSQQEIPAEDWFPHPEYSGEGFENDIVLLKLMKNATINEYVQCISIPKENESVGVGTECTVSGWGRTSLQPPGSDVLMEVELKVQNEEICEQHSSNFQCESMICVGDKNHKKSTYKGDSGGPLVCNEKAHGIVSGGYDDPLFPKVFARISYFEPWIRKQLKSFSLQDIPCIPFSD